MTNEKEKLYAIWRDDSTTVTNSENQEEEGGYFVQEDAWNEIIKKFHKNLKENHAKQRNPTCNH